MISAEAFGAATAVVAWVLTYGAHAAIVGGCAALLVRILRPGPAAEHHLWKAALLLPPLSASFATLLALRESPRAVLTVLPDAPVVLRVPGARVVTAALGPSIADAVMSAVALIVAFGIAGGAGWFAIDLARVRRSLGVRRPPSDPRLASSLARIAGTFALGPIELTESVHLASPTAFAARAICVPAQGLGLLADSELDAVLAHELAHLERRDPLWFMIAELVQAALWMQPLNRYIVARLRRSAEIACDERAVAVTGDARGLAEALCRLAHAAFDSAQASFPGAVRAPGVLVERVRRLAGASPGSPRPPSHPLAARSGAATLLLASVAIGCSGVTVAFPRDPVASARRVSGALPLGTTAVDVAVASRRAADLTSAEIRLEALLEAARARTACDPSSTASSESILALERDLRHAREERAWLEQSVTDRITH